MTRLKKWVKRHLEKLLGRWYEGQEPPDRLGEMVIAWMNMNPQATRGEFAAMAIELANISYTSGFERGVEYVERDPDFFADLKPDVIMDEVDPNWRWRPAITLDGDPDDIVFEDDEPVFENLTVDLSKEAGPDDYNR